MKKLIVSFVVSLFLLSSPAQAAQVFTFTTTSKSPPLTAQVLVIKLDATSAAFTHSLPDATKCLGLQILLIKIDSSANAVTIGTTSSQTILTTSGSSTTFSLALQGNMISVVSDGANWEEVGKI